MKKTACITFFMLMLGFSVFAQREEGNEKSGGFDKSKLFFGGNFGMSFGDQTFINISLQVAVSILLAHPLLFGIIMVTNYIKIHIVMQG